MSNTALNRGDTALRLAQRLSYATNEKNDSFYVAASRCVKKVNVCDHHGWQHSRTAITAGSSGAGLLKLKRWFSAQLQK